ncbi:MAG: hypothetical protein ACKO3T_25400 [Planctomycetaceae bacterium]
MLNRRNQLERHDAAASTRLQQALSAIGQRISDTRCHLHNMPIYQSLAAAGDAADHCVQIQQALLLCLQSGREALSVPAGPPANATADCAPTQTAVLSAAPATHAAAARPPASATELPPGRLQASDFLTPSPAELAETAAMTEPTVAELQQALRELVLRQRSETGSTTP